MDQDSISEPTAALTLANIVPVAQTSPTPSLRSSNRHAKRALRNSRVHFDEEGFLPPVEENPVVVKVIGEEQSRTVGVYLGFLQEEHKYEVKFSIPMDVCREYLLPTSTANSTPADGEEAEVIVEVYKKPMNCSIQKVEWNKTDLLNGQSCPCRLQISMELQLSNHSIPIFEDKFTVRSNSTPDRFLHISISAKIMGKHMGTPSLKDGIKCIGHCPAPVDTDDSENEQNADKPADLTPA